MPKRPPGRPRGDQRWATFLRNHAKAIIACDFFVAVTATFRLLYVFVLIHHGSRRLVHFNVTAHPTAAWTLQQLREAIGFEQDYRYLLHDRDSIFAENLDESIKGFGVRTLEIAAAESDGECRMRTANWHNAARVPGLADSDLRGTPAIDPQNLGGPLQQVASSYGARTRRARPATEVCRAPDPQQSRHRIREGLVVLAKSVLGGLHHEYSLVPVAP